MEIPSPFGDKVIHDNITRPIEGPGVVIGFINLIAIAMTILSVIRIARASVSRLSSAAPRRVCSRDAGWRTATYVLCHDRAVRWRCYDAARNSMSSQEDVCSLS